MGEVCHALKIAIIRREQIFGGMVKGNIIVGAGVSEGPEGAIIVIDKQPEHKRGVCAETKFPDLVNTNVCCLAQISAGQGSMSLFKPGFHDFSNYLNKAVVYFLNKNGIQ